MTTAELKTLFPRPEEWLRRRKVKDDAGNIVREFENLKDIYDSRIIITDPTDSLVVWILAYECGKLPLPDLKDSSRWWATPGAVPPTPKMGIVGFRATCVSCGKNNGLCMDIRPDCSDWNNPPADEDGCHLKFKSDGSILLTWDEGASSGWHKPTDKDIIRIHAFPYKDGEGCLFTCNCVEDETSGRVVYADGTVDEGCNAAEILAGAIIRGSVPIK